MFQCIVSVFHNSSEENAVGDAKDSSKIKSPHVGFVALLVKIVPKFFAILVKLVKTLKIGKVGLAGASLATYTVLYSWEFALLIMAALFVHESGHVWAMKRCGVKTKGFYFIPFLGGAAIAEEDIRTRRDEVYIVLMGPLWGLAFAAVTGIAYWITGWPVLAAAAGWMASINLFNMLPITPLDGGRLMKSVAFSLHSRLGIAYMGSALLFIGIFALNTGMGLFVFLLVVGSAELYYEWKKERFGTRRQVILHHLREMWQASGNAVLPLIKTIDMADKKNHPLQVGMMIHDIEADEVKVLMVDMVVPPDERVEKPKLTGKGIGVTAAASFAVIIALWAIADYFSHMPGAEAALELMK